MKKINTSFGEFVNKATIFFSESKSLPLIVLIYVILMISIIGWGLPNGSHPYTYHMDEWHQLR